MTEARRRAASILAREKRNKEEQERLSEIQRVETERVEQARAAEAERQERERIERELAAKQRLENYLHDIFDRIQGLTISEEQRRSEKTILLLAPSDQEHSLNEYYLNNERCVVLDAKKLHFDRTMKHKKLHLVLEEARRTLLHAMIQGKTVVCRLAAVCFDLLSFCDERCPDLDPVVELFPPYGKISYMPEIWHYYSGLALRQEEWYPRMIHRSDFRKDEVRLPCHPRFSVMFTSSTPLHSLDERLFRGGVGLPNREFFHVIPLDEYPDLEGDIAPP